MSTETNKYKTVDEILSLAKQNTSKFIETLKKEESKEYIESEDSIMNKIKAEVNRSEIFKNKFIDEIKNSLGEEIKQNANKVIVVKTSWFEKFMNKLKIVIGL